MPPDETKALISLFQVFNTTLPQVMAARDNMLAMEHLAGHLERYAESNHKLVPEFKKVTQALHEGIAAVRSNFDSHPYPFDHAESGISTASYFLRELPDADNPADVHEAARRMMERLPGLHARARQIVPDCRGGRDPVGPRAPGRSRLGSIRHRRIG